MTTEEIELCATLAGNYFGPDFKDFVSIVGGNDFLTLFHIRERITSYANKVQLAHHLDRVEHILKLLMKHRMVEARTGNGAAQYRIALRHIRIFMSFPRFKYHIEEIFGKLGSAIVEYLLENGHCQAYQIVEELTPFVPMYEELTIPVPNDAVLTEEDIQRAQYQVSQEKIQHTFSLMVSNLFIKKEPILVENRNFQEPGDKRFEVKFKNPAFEKVEGNPDYWCLDIDRLGQFTKDQLLVDYTRHKCGAQAAAVIRNILRLQEHTRGVLCYHYNDAFFKNYLLILMICNCLRYLNQQSQDNPSTLRKRVNVTLSEITRLCTEYGNEAEIGLEGKLDLLIRFQMLEKDGSVYTVLLFKMVEKMVQQCVLQWISTKYGMDARKIMALLFEGNYFEPKNVAKTCVMDEKDANQVLYRLMNDGLVSFQDMTPAGNFFPYYCTYLYTCNKVNVVHHARKAALNVENKLLLRKQHEHEKVKDLIKKKKVIDDYKASHPNENLEDQLLPREEREVANFYRIDEMLLKRINSLEQQIIISDCYIEMKRKMLKEECGSKGWDPVLKLAVKKKKAS